MVPAHRSRRNAHSIIIIIFELIKLMSPKIFTNNFQKMFHSWNDWRVENVLEIITLIDEIETGNNQKIEMENNYFEFSNTRAQNKRRVFEEWWNSERDGRRRKTFETCARQGCRKEHRGKVRQFQLWLHESIAKAKWYHFCDSNFCITLKGKRSMLSKNKT